MKKKLAKAIALAMAMTLLCSSCGLGSSPVADNSGSNNSTDPVASTNVKVGLEQNVHEIPDYSNIGSDVKVLRLTVSMGASDYGTSASGMMFKTFVDTLEEVSGGKMVAQVYPSNQLASTTDDIVNGLVTGAFEMSEVGCANWGD